MSLTLVLTSKNICEVAAAAIYHTLDPNSVVVSMSESEVSNTMKIFHDHRSGLKSVIMIGNYWHNELQDLTTFYPSVEFHIYCETDPRTNSNWSKVGYYPSNKEGLANFMHCCAHGKCGFHLWKLFSKVFNDVFSYCNDYYRGKYSKENREFFNGMRHYSGYGISNDNFDKFLNLFDGTYDLTKIMKIGSDTIYEIS